ncbi:hypothetical protein C8R43DRAFT_994274 [Mycena crocata]|nr:hypothetical protein C8R43DRAFT_994274 [Mycena crocata]
MSPNPDVEPRLPAELEREIFELSAYAQLRSIPSLILVAQRVKIWIEPILYRTFVVGHQTSVTEWSSPRMPSNDFLRLLDSRPATFFRDHVRHVLCDECTTVELEVILTKCSGTQDFCSLPFQLESTLLPLIAAMAPRRLDIPLTPLFQPGPIDLAHPLFLRVTHLCLDSNQLDTVDWLLTLASLQCLTHLACFPANNGSHGLLSGALAHCPHLLLLLLVWYNAEDIDVQISAPFAHDPRFVQLAVERYVEEWEAEARGGEGYWRRANAIVQERHSTIQRKLAVQRQDS